MNNQAIRVNLSCQLHCCDSVVNRIHKLATVGSGETTRPIDAGNPHLHLVKQINRFVAVEVIHFGSPDAYFVNTIGGVSKNVPVKGPAMGSKFADRKTLEHDDLCDAAKKRDVQSMCVLGFLVNNTTTFCVSTI